MIAPKPVLRRSTLSALMGCEAYEPGPSENASFGILVHSILADWTQRCFMKPDANQAELMDGAVAAHLDAPSGVPGDRFEEVRSLCEQYAQTHEPNLDTWLGCEVSLTWETNDAVLTGTLDRLDRIDDDALLITDVKTAWAPAGSPDRFQGRMYAALACLNLPQVQVVVIRMDYIRLSESAVVEWMERRDDLLAWWDREIVPGARRVVARLQVPRMELVPTGGAVCTYCFNRWACAQAVGPYRHAPQSAEQAHELFAETVRLEAAAEERRSALRGWYRERDPEVLNGLEVGYLAPREQSFQILDVQGAVQILREHGHNGDVLVVDQRRLNPRAKRALADEGVAAFADGDRSFRHRKAQT